MYLAQRSLGLFLISW